MVLKVHMIQWQKLQQIQQNINVVCQTGKSDFVTDDDDDDDDYDDEDDSVSIPLCMS